jgi:hypothetical protein
MLHRMRLIESVIAAVGLVLAGGLAGVNLGYAQDSAAGKGEVVMQHATGSFEVKLSPQKPDNPQAEAAGLGRMSLDKQFHGDLEATSQGEMLSVLDKTLGSGGYVAMERVTGKLKGKSGSFVLQHNATMNRGAPELNVVVVPDSGTGELTGIVGSMKIRIESGGKHFYDFDYTLDGAVR